MRKQVNAMSGKRGRVTIKDVASAAEVSVATVSYVLNNTDNAISAETRAHVQAIARQMNYRPNRVAKGLKTAHFNTLAVVVEDFRSFFIQSLIDGVCQCAEEYGYDVVLVNLRLDSRIRQAHHYELMDFSEYAQVKLRNVEQMQVDGLIYIGAFFHDVGDMLSSLSVPLVYLYSFSSTDRMHPSVHYDDYQAAYDATSILLRHGHTRIAHVAGTLDSAPGQLRVQGWRQALLDAGCMPLDELLFAGDFERDKAYSAGLSLLDSPARPTAVFAASDLMAKAVYDACAARHVRIPQDLSVVGIDNADFSKYVTPALTTMAMPNWDMGYRAAQLLLDHEMSAGQVRLLCQPMLRDSIATKGAREG